MTQFKTIKIPENAISLLQAGWELELNILKTDINKYKEKVLEMEKLHGMDSPLFKEKFESGLLGDDEWCFDWINYLDFLSELESKFEAVKNVCIK